MTKNHTAYNIIDKKKRGEQLTKSEIEWFIHGLTQNQVKDYQASALLMAIYLNGMTAQETYALTKAMMQSGTTLKIPGTNVIDKHSTGGIGDKASFVLAPIAAACGVKVPMMAGRGLGFTGGTVDKIEAVAGFQTTLSHQRFVELVKKHNIALIGQTADIAPADKILYALRDVTATIESIPLITASILSKKLAEGSNGIVMDIKAGSGAFMKDSRQAQKLATTLMATAKLFKKKMTALITNMDQPLGYAIGHSIEITESVETLKGNGPKDLEDLSVALASHMILLAGKAQTLVEAKKLSLQSIQNGKAVQKFTEMIIAQGGDPSFIDNPRALPIASQLTKIQADQNGYIASISGRKLGELLIELGGGRKTTDSQLDLSVGLKCYGKIGRKVKKGETIVEIIHHKKQASLLKSIALSDFMTITRKKVEEPPLIVKTFYQK